MTKKEYNEIGWIKESVDIFFSKGIDKIKIISYNINVTYKTANI